MSSGENIFHLGIDIGTTSVKVCIVDPKSRQVMSKQSKDTQANVPSDMGSEGNKQDVPKIISALNSCVSRLPKDQLKQVGRIGICGQMHGVMLWSNKDDKKAWECTETYMGCRFEIPKDNVSALYTWQDTRCDPGFLETLPVPRSHLPTYSGYGSATLFWISKHRPAKLERFNRAGTVQDFAVAMLCNLDSPIMSVQNAASWGYFDTTERKWNEELLQGAGFPVHLLPQVVKSGELAGTLAQTWYGIPSGTSVGAALADLPCSVLSTLEKPNDAVLNISTSAQLAFVMPENYEPVKSPVVAPVEYFPYFYGRYLAVAASLNGGNCLAAFVRMLQQWTLELGFNLPQSKIWDTVMNLGVQDSAVSTLRVVPTMLGERYIPEQNASVHNIDPGNLGLGQVFRAACKGIIENLHCMMPRDMLLASKIDRIIGIGTGLIRNKVLQKEVQDWYKLPVDFVSGGDAAMGAALAMVPTPQLAPVVQQKNPWTLMKKLLPQKYPRTLQETIQPYLSLFAEFVQEFEEGSERRSRTGSGPIGRTVTLQMLLAAGILEPGDGTMSIEYLGQRFIGDLLPDGKIKSQETDIIFASPSAWAINCKRIINPVKKSGCGWASVKYKGKKLDAYKNIWFKKRNQDQNKEIEVSDDEDMEKEKVMMAPAPVQRMVIKHNVIGSRAMNHDLNTLVESTPFSTMGKIQPFLVSMATNAVLVMDFHCHLTTSEVVGYLAGHWDVNAHNLAITHAFPCRSRLADRELAPLVEADIYRAIEQRHLTLVGWYHSHPFAAATPTLRDIDAQLEYQIRMKGNSDASYTPCVGVICSPYNHDCPSLESSIVSYWVMPPPETKPHEYGKPMLMSYSVVQDQFLSQDALNEMKRCVNFYQNERDFVKFNEKFKGNITYLDKLKTTLTSKFPRDQSDGILWGFIREMVCPGSENGKMFSVPDIPVAVSTAPPIERVNLLVPNVVPSSMKSASTNSTSTTSTSTSPAVTVGVGPSSSLMMGSDIASALFAGKFPSASSLMGLTTDPNRANLNMSNMFISPIGYKMDQISILKPVAITTSSPTTPTSSSSNNTNSNSVSNNPVPGPSKVSDIKVGQTDVGNFTMPENLEKICTKTSGQVL